MSAPKDEPKQWWTCGDAEITIKTHGSRAKLSFRIDAGWRTLNELLDLAKQHTEDPEDIAGIARETENTPAPKIYAPAPGRPPEWVVDLMVEGRVNVNGLTGEYCVATGERRGYLDPAKEGQAIRLNEDGSLEIIDAPKAEPVWWRERHKRGSPEYEAHERLYSAVFNLGMAGTWCPSPHEVNVALQWALDGEVEEAIAILRDRDPPGRAPVPTFTKSEVVEAMRDEARRWRARNDFACGVNIALRNVAESLNLDWGWPE